MDTIQKVRVPTAGASALGSTAPGGNKRIYPPAAQNTSRASVMGGREKEPQSAYGPGIAQTALQSLGVQLRAQGKTWDQIIDSAGRPGGEDLGF